jgi:hypothetical protein
VREPSLDDAFLALTGRPAESGEDEKDERGREHDGDGRRGGASRRGAPDAGQSADEGGRGAPDARAGAAGDAGDGDASSSGTASASRPERRVA